jgi:hypothetical protein
LSVGESGEGRRIRSIVEGYQQVRRNGYMCVLRQSILIMCCSVVKSGGGGRDSFKVKSKQRAGIVDVGVLLSRVILVKRRRCG